jgi:putative transcriptional regulator
MSVLLRLGRLLIAAVMVLLPQLAPAAGLANGVFLVARPELQDPTFRETVVLITQPSGESGPLGVIINRPLGARLSEILPNGGKLPAEMDAIFAGGPVRRDGLLFLVRGDERPQSSLHVLEDVYLSADRDYLAQLMRGETQVRAFRAFAGYSGWAPGQLQAEIRRGGWLLVRAEVALIFSADPARVWGDLIKRLAARKTAAGTSDVLPPSARGPLIPARRPAMLGLLTAEYRLP